jgi:hypothetical protein
MNKIRLNQYSEFEIECLVGTVFKWRKAIREFNSEGEFIFKPDFDEDTEICEEDIEGNFHIIKK